MTEQSKMLPQDSVSEGGPLVLLRSAMLYFKMLGTALLVYGMGYLRISTSWLIFGCLGFFVYSRAFQKRALIIEGLKTIGKNEKKVILNNIAVRELPSWVYFPDVERAEWLNQILARAWPYICDYATAMIRDTVQPSIENCMPESFKPFTFTKIDLGDTPLRIGGVKVYDSDNIKRNEIVMDLDLMMYSDARIQVQLGKIVAGIKEFELRGTVRVVLKPLVSQIPFAGACTICFLDNPDINFLLTDMGNILSLPGLQQTLMKAVKDVVATIMVIPNRIPVQLVNDLELTRIRFPLPHGVIRINVISGRDLKASDVNLIGKNSSDPYCIVKIGAQNFTTKTCQKTLNPTWNEYFEAVIDVKDGQNLSFEVWDKDQGNKDDPLGSCSVSIETVYKRGFLDSWINLEGVKRGSVHVKIQWMDLSTDTFDFRETKNFNENTNCKVKEFEQAFGSQLSSAYLFVLVDMAKNLPRMKSLSEPSPYASVRVNRSIKNTQIKPRTNNPVWENAMHFMVQNPLVDELVVVVRDSRSEVKLGERRVPLRELISEPNMAIERPYSLRETNSSEPAFVNLRLEMRAIHPGVDRRNNDEKDNLSPTVAEELINMFHESMDKTPPPESGPNPAAKIPINVQIPNGGHQGHSHDEVSTPSPKPSNSCGAIQLTMHYSADTNRLGVMVHACKDLLGVDKDGLADPYVRLQLKFLNGASNGDKCKTQVVKNTLEPNFEERFEFNVDLGDLESLQLHAEVKNHVGMFARSGNNVMGQCVIPLGSLKGACASKDWFWLVPFVGETQAKLDRSISRGVSKDLSGPAKQSE